MLDFAWEPRRISALFVIPGDDVHALRVRFEEQCIVRLLDDMPLSTEEDDEPNDGLVPDHFAYRVEGARFWKHQSSAFKTVWPRAQHYRLITGWTCLDVVCAAEPVFERVARTD